VDVFKVPCPERRLDAYLAEYERIWDELLSRFESQRQAFAFTLGIFGTLVTVITSMETSPAAAAGSSGLGSALSSLNPLLLFWVPLVVVPFGYIFFDNELMIWGIVRYTRNHLHDHVAALVGDRNVIMLEQNRFPDPKTRSVAFVLSLGRWILFIVPIVVALSYAIVRQPHFWSTWYLAIFALDLIATGLLLWAMVRAAAEQEIWKRIAGHNPNPEVKKPAPLEKRGL
jgi:hypothetical protein